MNFRSFITEKELSTKLAEKREVSFDPTALLKVY